MIIVTGGAGFIGSNLVRALNRRGIDEVVVVDDLTDGKKSRNLADCTLADYLDREEFSERLRTRPWSLGRPAAVFHQGACSTTTEWDGRYMMEVNYRFSRDLLHWCLAGSIPLIYASSAAVYGGSSEFREEPACERPLNVYGWSKLVFDQHVRRHLSPARSQVAGLRYFNVYGPGEGHKGGMASVAWHLHRQLLEGDEVRLFEGCDGYADGEQRRDFIHVDDVVAVNLWLLDNPQVSGIFNVGTGRSQTFNEVAQAVLKAHGRGRIRYIPFPDSLRGRYQSHTQADLGALRAAGYQADFQPVEQGVTRYVDWLLRNPE